MLKLKWLSGPLTGQEFDLPTGPTRIGGPDADIAWELEGGLHAVLTSSDEGVSVSQDAPVWVCGERWESGKILPCHQPIDMAGLAFVVGGRDETLSSQPVPARIDLHARRIRGSWLWRLGGLVTCFVLMALALLVWQPKPVQRFDVNSWLARQLTASEFDGLSIHRQADGSLALRGRCASSQDVERLRLRLRDTGLMVRDESLCSDTLRRNVRNVLAINGYYEVDVLSGAQHDIVEIRGAITSGAAWERTVMQLQTLPGLRAWRIVNDRALWFDHLYDILSSRAELDGLSIVLSGKRLIVSGKLDAIREPALLNAIDAFNGMSTDGFVASLQDVPPVRTASALLPAPVVTVGGSDESIYVILANGMRLQSGSVLPNGYAVVNLSRRSMSLLKEQHLISLLHEVW
ncbi:type III secretion system inner membrane ring subunit SctD [Burkholderia ubonensis]|uniref:type III secretion system inner membrane ring subunit SctD n=1 Tax=Burkholderia ubonensis TaxID=101571 RepID=UPI0007521186|nr:type III secretion system inner membrane ring subunit SctD [Burkholderia ubonensis]KWN58204.1 type III secretion protein [Burkholderia ubonensis]